MRVKEIIINKQPALLDNFLNEMLDFQTDNNSDVRRYILEFTEEAWYKDLTYIFNTSSFIQLQFYLFCSKTDPETIPKVLHNMMMMLQDKSVSVEKKAIQTTAKLYKYTLMWLCKAKTVSEEMESSWNSVNDLKKFILKLIDSDLDGCA